MNATPPDPSASDDAPLLRLHDVSVGYAHHRPLLEHVSLELRPGEVVALVGESGAGKTTVVKSIAGVVRLLAGRMELDGKPHHGLPPRGLVGYIPQRLGLLPHASALENVLMGALHREPFVRAFLRIPSAQALEDAHEALARVGLAPKADTPVKELSGGQQRRVAVARAILQRPRLLLADEFLGELDRRTGAVVESAVLELAEKHGTAIVLVEHHVTKAHAMADRVYLVTNGHLEDITDPARARQAGDDDLTRDRMTVHGGRREDRSNP